jgi:2,3-dimethylmalate lyase
MTAKLDFACLSRTGKPLLLPGAHDALSARMIEDAGFTAYGIGDSALSATQLAMPDAGLQSFGEYRDGVARIMEGSSLPLMVDGENGFGDAKAVTRTVRSFEKLGVAAIAFEDLVFPPPLNRPPAVIAQAEMEAKLNAALGARNKMLIIGRTDAAYASLLPHFRRIEDHWRGGDARHRSGGEVRVSPLSVRSPFYSPFLEAARQMGLLSPRTSSAS